MTYGGFSCDVQLRSLDAICVGTDMQKPERERERRERPLSVWSVVTLL